MGKVDNIRNILDYVPEEYKKELDQLLTEGVPPWVPVVGTPQYDALQSEADILFYGGAAGGMKLLEINTPIPTLYGWTTIGDLQTGDVVFDDAGIQCRVMAVSNIELLPELYRLRFDDGSEIDCCKDHLWKTYTAKELMELTRREPGWQEARRKVRKSRATGNNLRPHVAECNSRRAYPYLPLPAGKVRTTQGIVDTLKTKSGRANHAIKISSCLELPVVSLPIDPYVLGAWMGDGSKSSGGFTGIDRKIWEEIEKLGYKVTHSKINTKQHYIRGLVPALRLLGVLNNKYIPPIYLRASREQRLALLQGLMDTDGSVARNSGAAIFYNTNKKIIDGVYELIVSLGMKANIQSRRAKLYGKDCGQCWVIKWVPNEYVFRLPRKRKLQKIASRRTTKFRYVISAERIPSCPGRCIAVDSPSKLYLAGKSMIPTHNTDLLLGLALTEYTQSIIFRRQSVQLLGIENRLLDEILKSRKNWNGQDNILRLPDRTIELGSCNNPGDEIKYQGRPHQFKGFDEITHFTEAQFRFLTGWLRTTIEGVRCRVIAAGNPPTEAEGEWVISYWGPWLDPLHPNPAKPGELRWYAMIDGVDTPVDSGTPFNHKGELITPKSRTFIPSHVEDNPFLMSTGYKATLQALPEPLRSQMLKGDFMAGKTDNPWQVFPTGWVDLAMARWTPDGKKGQMDSLGCDVARGGRDKTQISTRYANWYDWIKSFPGSDTPNGQIVAGLIMSVVRDAAPIHIDIGGVGSSPYDFLNENSVQVLGINNAGTDRSKDQVDKASGLLKFRNNRSFLAWRFRESLEPEKGDNIALPPDPELKADLCALRWKLTAGGILIESKEEVIKRIHRSPDKGDASILASINTVKSSPKHQKNFRKNKGTWRSL
ncbi:MAG: LAGLIDADG family homing endonuclease [Smithella sp.]|nr:LAGLIDADG family homing endonuclease [Smithella sp.]